MWRPRLLTQVRYLAVSNPTEFRNRVQLATIRHITSSKDRKISPPSTFAYQTPATYHGGGPYITSPLGDGSRSWLPGTVVDRDCDQLRRLIRRLIESRELTAEAFRYMIYVSSTSYHCFMGQNGKWKGSKTATFARALHYFQQREELGVGISRKPVMKNPISKSKPKPAVIQLDGQALDSVPIYDTCDTIRRKINFHMRQPGVTSKTFLQHLAAQYHLIPTHIKISQLENFRCAKGANAENTNPVFYAAYVFFEKKRIAAKRPKSKLRERVEELYRETGGMNTKTPSDGSKTWEGTSPRGGSTSVDKYGLAYTSGSPTTPSVLCGQHGPLTSEQICLFESFALQDYEERHALSKFSTVI